MKYEVTRHITHDGEGFEPGSQIELTDAQAKTMGHAIRAVAKPGRGGKNAAGDDGDK